MSTQNEPRDTSTSPNQPSIEGAAARPSEHMRTRSRTGHSSRHSSARSHSSISSELAFKRAKVEGAKTGMEYAIKEANIQKQKTELETELKILEHEKEVAVMTAEVKALELANNQDFRTQPVIHLPTDDPVQRTQNYIEEHVSINQNNYGVERSFNHTQLEINQPTKQPDIVDQNVDLPVHIEARHNVHTPQPYCPPIQQYADIYPPVQQYADISTFMLRKDLLHSRLIKFDDKPESYYAWQAGFLSIVQELQLTPPEELDMLIKWLGPDSSKFAFTLKSVNIHNPTKGVERVWERLGDRYGSPEVIEAVLKAKLVDFPKLTNKDFDKLYDLLDILSQIESIKEDARYSTLLAYFDSSSGVNPIICKLPYSLQEKWTSEATRYKRQYGVTYPPFPFFVNFIKDMSKIKNDPSFHFDNTTYTSKVQLKYQPPKRTSVFTKKTDCTLASPVTSKDMQSYCPLHHSKHTLNECRTFRAKPIQERKTLLQEYGMCFRCCSSSKHVAKDCQNIIQCTECHSSKHPSALHDRSYRPSQNIGGERDSTVTSKCTQICGPGFSGKSCGKTVLVRVYPNNKPELATLMYAILDDQSNSTLAKSEFFDHFDLSTDPIPYKLSSCSGQINTSGRRASGFTIESLDCTATLQLPNIIECNQIPNIREEIPIPEIANAYFHLQDIAPQIPPINDTAQILLLIGRDLIQVHYVLEQRIGPNNSPYAQKLKLGWVIIGETCLNKVHQPNVVNVNKTYLSDNGHMSIFKPCPNRFQVKEIPDDLDLLELGSNDPIFQTTKHDNEPGLSVQDRQFIQLMDNEFIRTPSGQWIAPLPFKKDRPYLPNNKQQAVKRANILHKSLLRNPTKKEHFVQFMKDIINNGHAETAPPLDIDQECWYLPIFGVYHPQKPNQVRAVFDSSAQCQGISLNNVLLTGPDLTNNLLGILMRFRKENVAVVADIQQMFYGFLVKEEHRDFLRFIWYRDNDPDKELIEYRMCVHVFGNSPSPAVATYGLRKIAQTQQDNYGHDVYDVVKNNFYVDDALISLPTSAEAIDLLKRTQEALLKGGNLRLHKIASNSTEVMSSFPVSDRAKEFKDLDLSCDTLPVQRSLGVAWDLESDCFTFHVSTKDKPFSRRGILSTINSLYDPLGFVAPVIIQGKLILRELMSITTEWDEPLPDQYQDHWELWKNSLKSLESLKIPRSYLQVTPENVARREIHIFSDASEKAIAAVAYLKTTDLEDNIHVGFILGKAKVAPSHGHTIPRLELCAAVLAVQISETLSDQLYLPVDTIQFHTDSKVVLGYIFNESRRFHVYVSNRVDRIRKSTQPGQWSYVPSQLNPADQATRSIPSHEMNHSMWLLGPSQIHNVPEHSMGTYPLQNPETDTELRPEVITLKTHLPPESTLGCHRFEYFSTWKSLVNAILYLQHIAKNFGSKSNDCKGWHTCTHYRDVKDREKSEVFIIRQVQQEFFKTEITAVQKQQPLPKNSSLKTLNPKLDKDGLLCVGGRLNNSTLNQHEMNPIIIPSRHHIATLLVRHFHDSIKHQGRHFTEGAIRSAGYWIIGGKRLISSILHKCVKCRKQRGKLETQMMSDLPAARVTPSPPFTYVGVDIFGPWLVTARRTRGGQANNKRWAALFTCLSTRAVHIEIVEEMTASSFVNAVRRFMAIRGKVKEFRSDRGTNFVGSTDILKIDAINVEDSPVKTLLFNKGTQWIFNAPHSSHMGGLWERMIGISRRILDSMLSQISPGQLTHEVLVTFMAEVSSIINSRPILPVSSDPECPTILTPSTILTQKTDNVTTTLEPSDMSDMYRAQWKRVQSLSDTFWSRWKRDYLQTLQHRRKWQDDCPNLKTGDVVILKDKSLHRNEWPLAVVHRVLPSGDLRIRKAEVRLFRDGKSTIFVRPISDMVLLIS